jgi:glutathione S-transferase
MLTLHHAPQSRSSRIVWLLEEIGAPFQIEKMNIPRRDGSGASDPRNPHPDKKVPALVHDGVLVTESAAICLYLADAFPDARIGPRIGEPLRAAFVTWLAYYAGVIEPVIAAKASGATEKDPVQQAAYDAVVERIRLALERGPFVLGDSFSAADVLVTSVLQWARPLLPILPAFDAYVARMSERPALKRALQKDG